MKRIVAGLTGGIASGKSAAAEMFREAGAYIIDTDCIARTVSASGEVAAKLRAAFPEAFRDGVLDRRALRQIVFDSAPARERLNAVMHPLIKAETARQIALSAAAITVVVVPLLFEAEFDSLTHPNITVNCSTEIRIERLVKRDDISETLARRMIAAQWSDAQRAARADIVFENDGNPAQLRAQVLRVYCEWKDAVGR